MEEERVAVEGTDEEGEGVGEEGSGIVEASLLCKEGDSGFLDSFLLT